MDQDLMKKLAMLSGQTPDDFDRAQLSVLDKQQISDALETLYSGLSLSHWLDGVTLDSALKSSAAAVRNFVLVEIKQLNAAVVYLRTITIENLTKWEHVRIQSRNSNDMINCPPDKIPEWRASANEKIDAGIAIIKHKISEFDGGAPTSRTNPANTNVDSKIHSARQMDREHERERERK